MVPVLARAAVAAWASSGVFMETHPNPADQAKCDGPNSWPLGRMHEPLGLLKNIDDLRSKANDCTESPAASSNMAL